MKVRVGIDVGGTFTDAVALDNETYELLGSVKVSTTHSADAGVSAGIVESLHRLMAERDISPFDVVFIAHGTTQATNALLEGDVAPVGIVTLGSGLEGRKARMDSRMGDIELAPGKKLLTYNAYVDSALGDDDLVAAIDVAIADLCRQGAQAVVAAEAFSVDNAANETLVVDRTEAAGVPGTATNEISKLYGLKVRTRTAVVNCSILPKMLTTANMTEESINQAEISAPLMVMRCDGGVMTVDEVRSRPILTILSGPAAGVAGALMYERLSDGLFFEVGGTSTDISCVKDGRVMVKYAEVGGHKTYLNSLDVRTVGIGGGSMIEVRDGRPAAVGPRSAHIAGLEYEVYTEPLDTPVLEAIQPMPGDPTYAAVRGSDGTLRALTLSGAANIAGYVDSEDYATGDAEAARIAWRPLAEAAGCTIEEVARLALDLAAEKNSKVATNLMKDYDMNPRTTVFVGGGGGAATVVPHLAEKMSATWRTARNASVISPIGVALAMVRDTVERTIVNPTHDDVLAVRNEAEQRAIKSGAAPGTVEVSVEVDAQRNLVSAVAIGATELRSKDRNQTPLEPGELKSVCAQSLELDADAVSEVAASNGMHVMQGTSTRRAFFGLVRRTTEPVRVIDDFGVIRLQKGSGTAVQSSASGWKGVARNLVNDATVYDDGGASLPNVYLICSQRIVDLSGLRDVEQVISLGDAELAHFPATEPVAILITGRTD